MFYDSDVRDVLGTIRVRRSCSSRGGEHGRRRRRRSRPSIPGARHRDDARHGADVVTAASITDAYLDARRAVLPRAATRRRPSSRACLGDGALHRHRRLDRAAGRARRPPLGRAASDEHHRRTVRGCLARYRGRELDTAGDGFFAALRRPRRVVIRCARGRSWTRSRPLGARGAAPGFTRASAAARSTGKVADSPSRSGRRVRRRSRAGRRSSSRRPCATSSQGRRLLVGRLRHAPRARQASRALALRRRRRARRRLRGGYEELVPLLPGVRPRAPRGREPKDVPELMRDRNAINFADDVRAPCCS